MKQHRRGEIGTRLAVFAVPMSALVTLVTGTAFGAVNWTPGLAATSSANAQGRGFRPPTIDATTNATLSSIQVNWTAPTGGATPNHYTVSRCTGTSCTNFTAITTGTCSGNQAGTSCTDTGLTSATTYNYEVTSVVGTKWVISSASASGKTTSVSVTQLARSGSSNNYSFSGDVVGGGTVTLKIWSSYDTSTCAAGTVVQSSLSTTVSGSTYTSSTVSLTGGNTYYAQATDSSPAGTSSVYSVVAGNGNGQITSAALTGC